MMQNAQQKLSDTGNSIKNKIIEIRQGSGLLKFAAYGSLFLIVIFIILLILDYTAVLDLKLVNRNPPSTFDTIDITSKGTFKDIVGSGNASFNTLTAKSLSTDAIKTAGNKITFNKLVEIGAPKKPFIDPTTIYGPLSVRSKASISGELSAETIAALRLESRKTKDKDGKLQLQDLILAGKTIQMKDPLIASDAVIKKVRMDHLDSKEIHSDILKIKGNALQLMGKSTDKAYRALAKEKDRLVLNAGGDYESGVRVQGVGMYVPDGEVQATRAYLKHGFGPYQIQVGKGNEKRCMDESMFVSSLNGVRKCDKNIKSQKWLYDPIKRRIYNPSTNKCIRAGSSAWTIEKCNDDSFEQTMVVTMNDTLYNHETETCFDMSTSSRSARCSMNDKGTNSQRIQFIEPRDLKSKTTSIEDIAKRSDKTLKAIVEKGKKVFGNSTTNEDIAKKNENAGKNVIEMSKKVIGGSTPAEVLMKNSENTLKDIMEISKKALGGSTPAEVLMKNSENTLKDIMEKSKKAFGDAAASNKK